MCDKKSKLDSAVSSILSRDMTRTQKRLQGFKIAKLYFDAREYPKAKKYLCDYLNERNNDPLAHELMGEIYEALGEQAEAIKSFESAYKCGGPRFYKIIMKISELYCDTGADVEALKSCLKRCEKYFHNSTTAVKLKAHINRKESKNIPSANVQPQKNDELSLHMKLLNDLADRDNVDLAYEAAVSCNLELKFVEEYQWFNCLRSIFQKFGARYPDRRSTLDYNVHYIYILRNLTYLSLHNSTIDVCVNALNSFDQQLNDVLSLEITDLTWNGFIKEIKGQFFFLAGILLLKKALHDLLPSEREVMAAGACFVASYRVDPIDRYEHWFTKVNRQKSGFYKWWRLQSYDRVSQIGHMLDEWSSCRSFEWHKKINQFFHPDSQSHIYKLLFGNNNGTEAVKGSFFHNSKEMWEKPNPLKMFTEQQLAKIDKVACKHQLDNLSYLVWLCRQYYSPEMEVQPHYEFLTLENLQFGVKTNDNGFNNFLCATDVLVFLLATVDCSSHSVNDSTVIDPSLNSFPMPAYLTQALCTSEQAEWWTAAYKYFTLKHKSELSDVSDLLFKGIQTVRLIGQHGLSAQMMVHIARSLDAKLKVLKNCGDGHQFPKSFIIAIEIRAEHYWKKIKSCLKKMQRPEQLPAPNCRLFQEPQYKELSKGEIENYLSESIFQLALASMNKSDYPRAIEGFKQIGSVEANLHCAKAYKQWAEKEMSQDNDTEKKQLWIEDLLLHSRDILYDIAETNKADNKLMKDVVKELEEIERIIHKGNLSEVQDSFCDSVFILTPSKSDSDFELPTGTKRNHFNLSAIQGCSEYGDQVVQRNRYSETPENVSHQINNLKMSLRQMEYSDFCLHKELEENKKVLIKNIKEKNDQIIAFRHQMLEGVRDRHNALKENVEKHSEFFKDLKTELCSLKQPQIVDSQVNDIPCANKNVECHRIPKLPQNNGALSPQQLPVNVATEIQQGSVLKHSNPKISTSIDCKEPHSLTQKGQQKTIFPGNRQPQQAYSLGEQQQLPGTFTRLAQQGLDSQMEITHQKSNSNSLTGNGQRQQYCADDLSLAVINAPNQEDCFPDTILKSWEEIYPPMLESVFKEFRQKLENIEREQHKQRETESSLQEKISEIIKRQTEIQESMQHQTDLKTIVVNGEENTERLKGTDKFKKEREHKENLEDTHNKLKEEACREQTMLLKVNHNTHRLQFRNINGKLYFCQKDSTNMNEDQELEPSVTTQENERGNPGDTTDEINTRDNSITDLTAESIVPGIVRDESDVQDHRAAYQNSVVKQDQSAWWSRNVVVAKKKFKRCLFICLYFFCLLFCMCVFLWKMELIPIEIELNCNR